MTRPVHMEGGFAATRLGRFIDDHGYLSLEHLRDEAAADPAMFWEEMSVAVGLQWARRPDQVLDLSDGKPWPEWFVGGQLDLYDNLVGRHARRQPDKPALRCEDGDGRVTVLSYAQLDDQARRLAAGVSRLGIGAGDRIALCLPMCAEAAVLLLAAMRIGAIVVPMFSGYGVDAMTTRLLDAEAALLVCGERTRRRGASIDTLAQARAAASGCPSIRGIVVVRESAEPADQDRAVRVPEIAWSQLLDGPAADAAQAAHAASAPLLLMYTSGTTGRPKGVVHTHGGFPLKAAADLLMAFDFGADDVLCWITDMGWLMGPWSIYGALQHGATVVLFDGAPDYPDAGRLWRLVRDHGVTHLGVSPTLVRLLMAAGDAALDADALAGLRVFGATGEPWNDAPWHWLYRNVGQGRRPIVNYSGGTEIGGGILASFPGLPQRACAFHGPIPGMAVEIHQEHAGPGEAIGELVLKQPFPGMTRGFWRDDARYLETYWSTYEDTWVHGDLVEIDADGYWYVRGRSDDTLKIAGKRVGPVEYESVLVGHPAVREAVAVGVPHPLKGETALCLVILAEGAASWASLRAELEASIVEQLGKPMRPGAILAVEDIPRTRNGKILRRLVRNAWLDRPCGDLSALENPEAVAVLRTLGLAAAPG